MAMQKHMSFLILVYTLLSVLSNLKFGCGSTVGDYPNRSCVESEKQALLLLKESLVDDLSYLSSWIGDDCCAWHGIGCNNRTGHVTQLDLRNGLLKGHHLYPSLLDLKYLIYLDLSNNTFEQMKIPQFLGSFKDLTYLNLSYSNFEGVVPHHLGNLSKLRYLDLSYNYYYHETYRNSYYDNFNYLLSIDSMRWLSGLSMLKHLDLSLVNLSRAPDWFSSINMLSNSISVLKLQTCQLPNNIPLHLPLINLTSLVSLDLRENQINSAFPFWVLNNSGLAHLYLGRNHFNGSIPDSIGTLTSLLELDFSENNFSGSIPESIGRLKSLSSLDGSVNEFQGPLPECMGNLTSLTYLDLSDNNLRGGLLEEICQLSKLKSLSVDTNQLSGSIPECIGELSNLIALSLASNSWEGFVTERHLVNLAMLTDLSISSNSNLALNVSSNWVPPFQLQFIYLESMKVGPKFPNWLLTQRQIYDIRMRNTSISDSIPTDYFASLLSQASLVVDLSSNDINVEQLSSISSVPSGLNVLTLSNNSFSGEFPSFLCNITSLKTLVISNNYFSGELPNCLGNLTQLNFFDVMNNSFSGVIPVSLGSLVNLIYLNLHKNKFQGKLPMSFQNLKELVVFDVGKNDLSDTLPSWSGKQLPHLKYMILRSNNFSGEIPTQLCHYPSMQVLNLARNRIIGSIPPCFGNFSAKISSNNSVDVKENFILYYGEMIIDETKGYELKYTSTLKFLFSIDFSNNNIGGEIPEELMDLSGLLNLNLAGNHITGRIPERIGKLENLEVLDLSRNKLYGSIPQSLSDLNFLSRLNLSFNNLSGRIPTGYQLQTLEDPSIYAGNNQLCGQPILKPCDGDTESLNVHDYNEVYLDSGDERVWFYAGIGPGLLCGFLGFCASLHFIKSWRYSYFHFVEIVFDKIAVASAVLRRKFQNGQTSGNSR